MLSRKSDEMPHNQCNGKKKNGLMHNTRIALASNSANKVGCWVLSRRAKKPKMFEIKYFFVASQ